MQTIHNYVDYLPSINELTIIALKAFPSPLIRNLLIGSPRMTSINLTEPGTPIVNYKV
jgi:hypothetical protein